MSIKVLLVDDHAIIREGLRSLLERQPGMEVIADTDDGRKAIELVREQSDRSFDTLQKEVCNRYAQCRSIRLHTEGMFVR
jgi:DNA-binding NarL/FixJ family response regulator